jgi:hypothetical protein
MAMPTKQRCRCDYKRAPACSRHQTARGSEKNSIRRVQLGPRELAAQYGELVAEDNDLELFELIRPKSQRRKLQHASKHQVTERPEQGQVLQVDRRATDSTDDDRSRHRTELMHPTRFGFRPSGEGKSGV